MNRFSSIYRYAVFLLMAINLIYLTNQYMKYATETNTAYHFPVVLEMSKLSLCFDMPSFLREERLWVNESTVGVSFHHMFQLMPPVEELLLSCKHRDVLLDIMIRETNSSQCAKYFDSKRFKMMNSLCYRLIYRPANSYDFHAIVNSLYEPRALFSVEVGVPISKKSTVLSVLHLNQYPFEERLIVRLKHVRGGSLFNLAYESYEWHSLPRPYETRCVRDSKLTCLHRCLLNHHQSENYVWPSTGVLEGTSEAQRKPMLEISQQMGYAKRQCRKACETDACHWKGLNTHFLRSPGDNLGYEYIVSTTVTPPLLSIVIPAFSFGDFLLQLAAICGIFLGVSFLSINILLTPKEAPLLEMRNRINRICVSLRNLMINRRRVIRAKPKLDQGINYRLHQKLIEIIVRFLEPLPSF